MHKLTISVADLLGRPGRYRDIDISEPLAGVAGELASLTGAPVSGRLRLESVIEGVLVTGRVTSPARFECARCLKNITATVEADLCELFTAPGHGADADAYRMTGTEIALEPMLVDAVALAFPLRPLCSPGCKGLCARCGADLNTEPCACPTDEIDPRWRPLEALKDKLTGAAEGSAHSA